MSAIHPPAATARFALAAALGEPRGNRRGRSIPAMGADLPAEEPGERIRRRIQMLRAEPDARPSPSPAAQTADLAGRDEVDSLARGVGRSITPDGLEWLLRRHPANPVTPAAALRAPQRSPGSDGTAPADDKARSRSTAPPPASAAWPAEPSLPGETTAEAMVALSTAPHPIRPDSPDRGSPKPAKRSRRRSTIDLDPLDTPLDARGARGAADALIRHLEAGRIERP